MLNWHVCDDGVMGGQIIAPKAMIASLTVSAPAANGELYFAGTITDGGWLHISSCKYRSVASRFESIENHHVRWEDVQSPSPTNGQPTGPFLVMCLAN
jgi:hypothetical protein